MKNEVIKLRLFEARQSKKAIAFVRAVDDGRDEEFIWIPMSQIEHITRRPHNNRKKYPECEVTMTEWIAGEKGLL